MTIATNFAAKLSVAFVATAMLFSFAAPSQAQTVEELQQLINDLMTQIASLEGSTSGSMGTGSCVMIPAPLTIGSTGADVTALQNVLISNGYTIPAGATGYFGGQTQSALAAWQADMSISPAVGYYGPISKAALDASCASDDMMDDDMDDMDDDMMDDDDDMMLSGEGTLDDVETDLDDASDSDIMEGEDDAEIGTLTLGAEDGDILVQRLTFSLADAGGTANEEDEPWDVFTEYGLWVDGDKVASFEADDEDAYLTEDTPFEFRFTGIDVVIEEDEEVEFVISASVMNSVDGADTPTAADWDLDALEIRYFDADDVATDDTFTVGAVDFSIEEEGADDAADLESSSDDPDQATLEVDDNSSDSDEFDVFIFDIEVDEDSNDLLIDDYAYATVTISNPASAGAAIMGDDVIEDVFMTIDGEKVEGDDLSGLNASIAAGASQEVLYEFDFDELELESDTDYEVVVSIVFRGQDGNYGNGVSIEVLTDGSDWDVDGVEDDGVLSGTADSETHTLSTAVPVISNVSSNTDRNEAGDSGTISFEFTIEAQGDNDVVFDTSDIVFTTTGGAATTTAVSSFSDTDGDVDQSGSTWTIQDGDEATFALDVTFTTATGTDNGTYRVTLETVAGVEVDETSNGMSLTN